MTQLGYYDLEKTPLIACQLDQRFGYCLYVSRGYQPGDPDTGLAVVVHGTLRTPERYREEFSAFAEEAMSRLVVDNVVDWFAGRGLRTAVPETSGHLGTVR